MIIKKVKSQQLNRRLSSLFIWNFLFVCVRVFFKKKPRSFLFDFPYYYFFFFLSAARGSFGALFGERNASGWERCRVITTDDRKSNPVECCRLLGRFFSFLFFFFFRLQSSDCVKLLVLLLLFRLHSGPFPDGLKLNDRQEATVSSSSPVRRQMTWKTTHVPMFKEFQP